MAQLMAQPPQAANTDAADGQQPEAELFDDQRGTAAEQGKTTEQQPQKSSDTGTRDAQPAEPQAAATPKQSEDAAGAEQAEGSTESGLSPGTDEASSSEAANTAAEPGKQTTGEQGKATGTLVGDSTGTDSQDNRSEYSATHSDGDFAPGKQRLDGGGSPDGDRAPAAAQKADAAPKPDTAPSGSKAKGGEKRGGRKAAPARREPQTNGMPAAERIGRAKKRHDGHEVGGVVEEEVRMTAARSSLCGRRLLGVNR